MIGKLPSLQGDNTHEHAAQELHNLTDVKLDACMRIVCQVDNVHRVRALVELVKMGVTIEDFMSVYEALSELHMLTPPMRRK